MGSGNLGRHILLLIILVIVIDYGSSFGRASSVGVAPVVTEEQVARGAFLVDSIYDPPVVWPTRGGLQQTGKVNSVFDCCGVFGQLAYPPPAEYGFPAAGFQAPAWGGIDYLSAGAIWVGGILGSDTLVSVGTEGWNLVFEMFPPDGRGGSSVIKIDCPTTDFSMRALFTDTITEGVRDDYMGGPYKPLHIRLSNRSYVRRSDPYRDCILYDLVVTNIGTDTIHHAYVGFHADGDATRLSDNYLGFMDDLSGSIRSSGIAYTVDNNGDPVGARFPEDTSVTRAFAFAFLNSSFVPEDTNFNWWVSNGSLSLDFGPRQRGTPDDPFRDFGTGNIGTPLGNANQYYVMRHREWDYDQCRVYSILPIDSQWMYTENRTWASNLSQGADTRFLMSIGPFDLAPDSSARVQFSTFTADSIHTDPDILQYLPYYPSAYTAMLGVERLVPVAAVARQFGLELLDPTLPPVGFEIQYESVDSIVYEWDPWTFSDVTGYRLLLGLANPADLPHPGVIPPWQVDVALDSSVITSLPYRHSITDINRHLIYVARLRHITTEGEGQLSPPASIHVGGRPAAPTMTEYSFTVEGSPLELKWKPPSDVDVDHYNVYKFSDSAAASKRYLPFYDTRELTGDTVPSETITVEGKTYYYYEPERYATVPDGDSVLVDNAEDGNTYVVTAVDTYGFESEMSAATIVYITPPRDRDVLVLTNSSGSSLVISSKESIEAFYDSVFAGTGLDYEVYDVRTNCVSLRTCPDWKMFLPFRWVIIDDVIYDGIPYNEYETVLKGFCRYLLSGGNLAYFGAAFDSWSWISLRTPPMVIGIDDSTFIRRFFGLDSITFVGATYNYPEPVNDSLFGFEYADAVADLPGLRSRTDAYPLGSEWERFWPLTSPPGVSTYWPDERAVVTHRYSSRYPSTSLAEGNAVGLWTSTALSNTYLFGFHLYYMRVPDAKGLLGSMMAGNRAPVLLMTGEEHFEADAVYPDTGSSSTVFSFRVRYDDPENDPPASGYPRVYIHSAQGCATGSPFVMNRIDKGAPPEGSVYSVDVSGLLPGSYTYRIEARDTSYALAGGEASVEMAGPFVRGDIRHVAVDGSDVTGDGSEGAPFGTIQFAINASIDGDAVVVHDGEYAGAGNFDIDVGGRGVIVRSLHGPSVTTIDAGGSMTEPRRVFDIDSSEGAVLVEGFTIAGGYSETGSGVRAVNSSPTFRGCVFTRNVASTGPAVAVYDGLVALENCTIAGNVADSGGCVVCDGNSPRSGATLQKCIIAFNAGSSAVVCDGDSCGVVISDCDIYQNEGGDWVGCIAGNEGILGNFSSDPEFCDTSSGDYSLRDGSPCLVGGNLNGVLIGALGLGCVPTWVGDDNDGGTRAHVFSLSQNYPNPFNSSTSISFSIPEACRVTVSVYNVLGQRVATVLDASRPAGSYVVPWDGTGWGGAEAASGVYFYRVKAGAFVETRKMLLVK